jgi:nitroreductase
MELHRIDMGAPAGLRQRAKGVQASAMPGLTSEPSPLGLRASYPRLVSVFPREGLFVHLVSESTDREPRTTVERFGAPSASPTRSAQISSITLSKARRLLVVTYDPRRRAPASEHDLLGMMSLGCVMENMWLVPRSLGIGFQVQSVLTGEEVEKEAKRILGIPDELRIAFAVRLGYPSHPDAYLRVRRDIEDFTHRNRFGQRKR